MSKPFGMRDFSPTPWHMSDEFTIASADGYRVCGLPSAISHEHEGNARLILAAPELLEALKELVETYEEFDAYPTSDAHPLYKAREVIAKAEGNADV